MFEKNGFLKFSVIVAYSQIINQTKCSFTVPSQFLAVAEYFLLIFQKLLVTNAVK